NKLIMRPPVIYPVATGSSIVTVDFDRETSRIYWADATQKKIWSAFQNGTEKREVFSGGLMVPESIAVDWIGRNLYWTDSVLQHPHGMTIFEDSVYWSERYTSKVVSTNKFHGGNITVLFNNIYQPMGIVMDHPIKQPADESPFLMVVRDSVIFGIPLDPTDPSNNAMAPISGISMGQDIDFDDQEQYVYWVQSPIECGTMDGVTRVTVVSGLSHPWGLTVYQSYLYYTDLDYEVIERVDKENGANMVVMRSGISNLHALKVHARDRFYPSPDGTRCEEYESFAVVATTKYIRGFHINSSDHSEAMVPIDGGSFSRVISSGVGPGGIQGLAVDWVAGNIYFTNAFEKQTFLEVLTINTTYRMVLLKSFEDQPRDLAVSPKLRYLFWTDGGQSPKIERALLDGTNRTVLASESLASPRGLIVDYTSNFLYWTDDVLDMISRMAIDGTQRQIIRYGSRYPSPTGLAIFGNYMLWPTSANLVGFNPCHDNNGRCQQLCFAIPDQERPKCGCAHGSLLSNGVSCGYGLDDFLVFTTDYTVNSLRLDPTDHSVPYPTVDLGYNVLALDYDFKEKRIFFTQLMGLGRSRIGYITTTSITNPPVILASDGLAYDWIHKRLYFTDYYRHNVQSIGLDGQNRSVIAHANLPRGIIVDPCYGYMYWTDWGTPAKIERATLGGHFRSPLINDSLITPNGLSIDYEERMLYWADASLDKIERATLTGENRQVIVQGVNYPFSVTVFQQDIFWTDWTERGVFRAGKDDGSGFAVIAQDLQYRPNDIHVYSGSKQEVCSSFCQQFNGGCSHICVSGPVGPECQCPHEGSWYLANNGKDCIKDTGKRCQPEQFTCLNGNCISARWKCDGYNDCQDNSDEQERVCAFHTCSSLDFTCDNGRCVFMSYVCDYTNDCVDNSDERGCAFPTCNPATEFTCSNGRCINSDYVCDGRNDCRDNNTSDEIGCRDRTCSSSQFTCPTWYPGHPRCVPLNSVCDGEKDCANAADELQNCPNRTCHLNEFACANGLCILIPYHDELNCKYDTCSSSQFTCSNGACIPPSYTCDGDNDCLDGSDEADSLCVTPQPTCSPQQYMCNSGECIDLQKLCTDTLTGYYCSCSPGYRLMPDGKACEDLNECTSTPAVCSQICENSVGSFHCKCAPGYIREPDGRTCRQNSGIPSYLLYTNRYYIRYLYVDGSKSGIAQQGLSNVVAVDYDDYEKWIYWLDVGAGKIERKRFDGSNRQTLVDHNIGGAEGLVVDWVGRKLYWVDSYYSSIHVMELDGRYQKKLVTGEFRNGNDTYFISRPRAVAVNPKYGWLYWTDWGDEAYIGRVGMDGKNISAIITTKLEWPNALTIDYTTNKIFFADSHLNFLE
ncbi:hypothetical protein GOODEAATRI_009041, partial [Goodea atripinnis]